MAPTSSPTPDPLLQTRKELRTEVFALIHRPADFPRLSRELLELPPPLDPGLARDLDESFDKKVPGRRESLKMEIDILRRLKRCTETERIIRAYGVVNLVTPVKFRGRTVYALISGPLKVSPWNPAERETLARLCGLRPSELPKSLDHCAVFRPEQIEALTTSQRLQARRMESLLEHIHFAETQSDEPETVVESPMASPGVMDLLQPGFADHLDVLFRTVQRTVQQTEGPLDPAARERLLQTGTRGRHLVEEIRRIGKNSQSTETSFSLHRMLQSWCDYLHRGFPSLRCSFNLDARPDTVRGNPHAWNHVLYTLLTGVVDGLPEATGTLGIGTRATEHNGRPCLHLEIRDGGGLETFAGVGRPLDREILTEQNEVMDELSDWMALAEEVDADLRVLREDGVVSRVELWIYTDAHEIEETALPPLPAIWVVEDDDREYENLLHMLEDADASPVRLHSAAELRDHYPRASIGPSLVILKYLLPDERGAGLRTWLYEQDPDLPVILVSGFSGTHPGIATVSNLPSTLYLQKPFDRRALLDMLNMSLDDPSGAA